MAAIILWNTAYLDRALQLLLKEGIAVPEDIPPHISPLGYEHITITGTYQWRGKDLGHVQPLRWDAIEFLRAHTLSIRLGVKVFVMIFQDMLLGLIGQIQPKREKNVFVVGSFRPSGGIFHGIVGLSIR